MIRLDRARRRKRSSVASVSPPTSSSPATRRSSTPIGPSSPRAPALIAPPKGMAATEGVGKRERRRRRAHRGGGCSDRRRPASAKRATRTARPCQGHEDARQRKREDETGRSGHSLKSQALSVARDDPLRRQPANWPEQCLSDAGKRRATRCVRRGGFGARPPLPSPRTAPPSLPRLPRAQSGTRCSNRTLPSRAVHGASLARSSLGGPKSRSSPSRHHSTGPSPPPRPPLARPPQTDVARRAPVAIRSRCTTRSSALATCWRTASEEARRRPSARASRFGAARRRPSSRARSSSTRRGRCSVPEACRAPRRRGPRRR